MSPRDARRVAGFHATDPGCRTFPDPGAGIGPKTWRQHFEYDLDRLNGGVKNHRKAAVGEVDAIVTFLKASNA